MIHCTGKPIGCEPYGCMRISFSKWNGGILSPVGMRVSLFGLMLIRRRGSRSIVVWRCRCWRMPMGIRAVTRHMAIFFRYSARMTPFNGRGGLELFPRRTAVPCQNGIIIACAKQRYQLGGQWQGGDAGQARGRARATSVWNRRGPVQFRNLKLKELPSTGAKAEETAHALMSFESVYWSGSDWLGGGRLAVK